MAHKYRIQYSYTPDNLTGEILTTRDEQSEITLNEIREAFSQWIKVLDSNNGWDITGTNLTGTYAHSDDDGITWVTDATIHLDNDFLYEFDFSRDDETNNTMESEMYDVEIIDLARITHIMERNFNDVTIVGVSHS